MILQSFKIPSEKLASSSKRLRRTLALTVAAAVLAVSALSAATATAATEPVVEPLNQAAVIGSITAAAIRAESFEPTPLDLRLPTPQNFADVAKVKAERTLYAVIAQNSVTNDAASIVAGEACEIYSSGSLRLLQTRENGEALVEYRPGLVFLIEDELVDLWSATEKAGLGYFCPAGTQFTLNQAEVARLDRKQLLAVDVAVQDAAGQTQWEARHLQQKREASKVKLEASTWAQLEQPMTTAKIRGR